ncbi:hypothetical protein FDP41_010714 [Naegleria fowleri]|uniref:Uncharacterized protein n=2 Tax=Naegleria fowleri TaxID=5763 RepID=A0A6A5CBM4_NAEFO|nr:uncharacterized protein FDP41_010714 [Naegleria fowleri]KAF0982735.1 hypothetical protein FDP41_010714 [Naegleria fowleri]
MKNVASHLFRGKQASSTTPTLSFSRFFRGVVFGVDTLGSDSNLSLRKSLSNHHHTRNTSVRSFHTLSSLLAKDEVTTKSLSSSTGPGGNGSGDEHNHVEQPTANNDNSQASKIVALSFNQYKKWTAQEVASILTLDDDAGGAALSVDDVKPLVEAGFKGNSLDNIVKDIKEVGRLAAIASLTQSKDCTQVPSKQAQPFYDAKFDGTTLSKIVYELEKAQQNGNELSANDIVKQIFENQIDLSTCTTVVNWIKDKLIEKNKIQLPLLKIVSKHSKPKYIPDKYIEIIPNFSDEELYLLQEISELKLRDLSHVHHGLDRLIFNDMLNREQAKQAILDLSARQYEASQQEKINKQDLTFLIAKGGSGSGKTRIMSEVVKILSKAEPQYIFKNSSIIYFNFTNGFVLQNDVERDSSIISLISSRIIYAAFEQGEEIAKRIPKITNDYFLYELLRIISSKLHEQLKVEQSMPIPLILAFDEYQRVTRLNQNLNTQLQHKIGWYMRHFQKKQGLILFPSFSGTLMESDAKFEPTDYQIRTVPLPSLRQEDVEIIMKEQDLIEFYTPKYQIFWSIIGVVPRHLEWAVRFAKEIKNNTTMPLETKISNIYGNVVKEVYKIYQPNDEVDVYQYLSILTLSGFPYSTHKALKYDSRVEELTSQGRIYKTNDHIGLPLPAIDILSESNEKIPKSLFNDFVYTSTKPDWEKFEELCLKTITCKLNYILKLKPIEPVNTFTVGELFQGAHMTDKLAHMTLTTNIGTKAYYRYVEVVETISKSLVQNENMHNVITKAKPNQQGIDGFLPVFVSGGRKVLFVVQNKFMNDDSQIRTLEPKQLCDYYNKALLDIEGYDIYPVIFSRKKVSDNTAKSVRTGIIPTSKETPCPKLILVSGDCFDAFFHPFIANILKLREKSYEE